MSESTKSSNLSALPSSGSLPDAETARRALEACSTVVMKVGSSVLCADPQHTGSVLHRVTLEQLCDDVEALKRQGRRVIVVSSGAIALGTREVGLDKRPADIASRQALAAIGQSTLMRAWREALKGRGIIAAQVLLTHADLANRKRYLNARRAMNAMLDFGAVPIVNENDTVSFEEIRFGDNDSLSAMVAALLDADLLALLSTHDGLFDKNPDTHPDAQRVPYVDRLDAHVEAMATDSTSAWGTGGMASKVEAAKAATRLGAATVIARGRCAGVMRAIVAGCDVGTLFRPEAAPLSARKHWIAYTLRPAGDLIIDDGATRALRERGRSLLASGVRAVVGRFDVGDPVRVLSQAGVEVARGLVSYGAADIERIAGAHSDRIAEILGYRFTDEVIHRDDLILV
jgi:glutamate 5-kinase